jgi:hypothetical protein
VTADSPTRNRLKALGRRIRALGTRSRRPPEKVFVLGNQKSGTTAIAALLARCIDRPFLSDVLYRHKLDLKNLLDGDLTIGAIAEQHPESFTATVVKDNDFSFLYPQLRRAFPDAAIVFVVRDPRQNVRSILNRVKLPGNLDGLSQEQYDELAATLPGWHKIVTGSSFGTTSGHYIDVLADRWVRANQTYLDARSDMTLVRYEDFDANKRPYIERLATDLGFQVAQDISGSQNKQFQPRGNRKVTPEAFFGPNLQRLEERCAPLMPQFGYDPTPGLTR